jgi:hypothetical protein
VKNTVAVFTMHLVKYINLLIRYLIGVNLEGGVSLHLDQSLHPWGPLAVAGFLCLVLRVQKPRQR